jgi:hypothetical protein
MHTVTVTKSFGQLHSNATHTDRRSCKNNDTSIFSSVHQCSRNHCIIPEPVLLLLYAYLVHRDELHSRVYHNALLPPTALARLTTTVKRSAFGCEQPLPTLALSFDRFTTHKFTCVPVQ